MTTTQSVANHHLTVDLDDDNMEMATSPYRNNHDDDIDFDLDEQREQSVEDNSMIDDTTDNLEINPNQDDMMLYDEDDNDIDFDEDLPMEPTESSVQNHDIHGQEESAVAELQARDQSIEDASFEDADLVTDDVKSMNDEGSKNHTQEEATNVEITITEDDATIPNTEENEPRPQDDTVDNHDGFAVEEDLTDTQATDVKDFAVETSSGDVPEDEPENSQSEQDPSQLEPSVEVTESPKVNVESGQAIEVLAAELEEQTEDQNNGDKAKADASTSDETQKSPQREATPVNLHPVTIRYNGEDCWLFPPLDTTETKHVFLDDPALASEPFDRLIAALRTALINDQEMADHDEIVFDIPVLGLHICEDSRHASLLNLSRIIDIYMMLSQNEGLTMFEPLYCELSTRVCLADQFAYVEDAAFVRRITYTEYAAEQAGSPEDIAQNDDHDAQEEQEEQEEKRADDSTYFDAAADPNDEEEQLNATVEVQDTQDHGDDAVEHELAQTSQPEAEVDTIGDDVDQEDSEVRTDTVASSTELQSKPELGEAGLVAKAENGIQDQSNGDDDALQVQADDATTKQTDEVLLHAEPEADEDLFADDPAEPEVPDLESEKTSQAPEAHSNEADLETLERIEENDDFDFENWSDDEQDTTKTEDVSNLLSTPSKSVNSKRKFIGEDDDFLEIDVSTPEPKRSRQS